MKNSKKVKKYGFWIKEVEVHIIKGEVVKVPVKRYIFCPEVK